MRVAILGASGGVGRWVTRFAVEAGHAVSAVVRPERTIEMPRDVRVLRGSALDPDVLANALRDQEVVLSCLGAQRTRPWNPWAPLRVPTQVAEPSARALVAVLPSTGVRRIAVISAAGVGDSIAQTNGMMRWMLRHSTVGQMYADLGRMEEVLRASTLDWVAVRPVTLVDAKPSARARELTRYRAVSVIGRADVASWLLRVATAAESSERTAMIGWW